MDKDVILFGMLADVCGTQMEMYVYPKEWYLLTAFPQIAFNITNGFKPKLKIPFTMYPSLYSTEHSSETI
jgi:hypothetical protein